MGPHIKPWLLAAAATVLLVAAAPSPPGVEGRDWAQATFTLRSSERMQVTADNRVVEPQASTIRTVLSINGRDVVDTTAARSENQITYIVAGAGDYQALVQCLGRRGDADRCGVTLTRSD